MPYTSSQPIRGRDHWARYPGSLGTALAERMVSRSTRMTPALARSESITDEPSGTRMTARLSGAIVSMTSAPAASRISDRWAALVVEANVTMESDVGGFAEAGGVAAADGSADAAADAGGDEGADEIEGVGATKGACGDERAGAAEAPASGGGDAVG